MAKALRVTFSARAVVAKDYEFSLRPGSFADADVAMDELLSLPPPPEPLVLRVTATGGLKAERARVEGDWLCDATRAEPRRLLAPVWTYSEEATAWAKTRPWLEAWETCEDARWMLHAAVTVGVDRRLVVRAACACARTVLGRVPAGEERPRRAIETAEAWARGETTLDAVRQAAYASASASTASASADAVYSDVAYSAYAAAYSAYAPTSDSYSYSAASAATSAAVVSRRRALADMATLVRGEIATLGVLRAATERTT